MFCRLAVKPVGAFYLFKTKSSGLNFERCKTITRSSFKRAHSESDLYSVNEQPKKEENRTTNTPDDVLGEWPFSIQIIRYLNVLLNEEASKFKYMEKYNVQRWISKLIC